MRLLCLTAILFLAGCSSLGDLQGTPEALRTYDSVCKRLTGHSCGQSPVNAPQVNRTVGQWQQMPYHLKHGQPAQKAAEIQELLR